MNYLASISKKYIVAFHLTAILAGLYFTSLFSYLLFHSLAEAVTIVVGLAIFLIIWNSWRYIENSFFFIIGIAFLFSGIIDLFHLFAYKGINIISDTPNLATQFWLAGRYMMSISFFIAPFFASKKIRIGKIFLPYFAVTSLVFLSIFYWKNFPVAYGENGLTSFKIISEYVISALYLGGMISLYLKRKYFDRSILLLLYWALGLKIAAEILFTQYIGVYDFSNLFGHLLRIISAYLSYLGIVEIALRKPYRLLFKNLKDSEVAARSSEERYRSIVELSPEAIFVHRDGDLLYINPAGLKLFGASNEIELLRKKIWELISPEYKDLFIKAHRDYNEENSFHSPEEIKIIDLYGKEADTEVRGKKIFYQGAPAFQSIMSDISVRKGVQEALMLEKNKLIKILDSMQDGVYVVNQEFDFEYINPALKRIFGEPGNLKCYEYFNNRKERCPWCRIDEVKSGKTARWEYYFERVGRDFDIIDNPILNSDGSVSKLTILRDVSENKKIEKLLKDSERRYRTIFENTGTATMLIDDDSIVALSNSQFQQLSGYTKEEIEGKMEWKKFVSPEDLERLEGYRRQRLMDPTKAPRNYELNFITKSNETRYVFATIERVPEIKRTIASLIDITDRKQLREILKESELRHQALGELIPFGIWVCDAKGTPLYLSQAYLDKIGMTLAEYQTVGWKQIVHPDDWKGLDEDWKKCVKEGNNWTHEHRIKDSEGKYYAIFSKGMPQKDENGNIISWTGIDLDISERRLAEEALKHAHGELEIKVKDRTKELIEANEKLTHEMGIREKVEIQLEMRNSILGFLSQAGSRKEYLDLVANYLKNITGCNYVGIRVIDDEKRIPYESFLGFSREFFESENMLSLEKDECVCIRVASGRPEPVDLPYITRHGSFYSGDTLALSESLNEEERKCFRGTCIKSGFLTVAVIPISDEGKISGVIHIADKEKDKLKEDQIEILEQLNLLIGEGISKFNLSDKIRKLNQDLELRVFERTRELQSANETLTKEIVERRKVEEEKTGLLAELELKSDNIENLAMSLKKERDMLKIIMENTGAHLVYLDRDFNFMNINSAYALGAGFTKNELAVKNYFELFPDEENRGIFERVRDTGVPVEIKAKAFIFPHQPWRGTTYWDWTLIPIRNEEGVVEGLVFSSVDVTDRKRDEYNLKIHAEKLEQLTDDLKKFQLAVENASDLIIITDIEGRILFVNSAAKDLTGYGLEDIIGKTPSLWGDESSEAFYAEAFDKIRESKTPLRGEVGNYRKDGKKFIGQLHISPVLSEEKEVIFFVGIMRDITEAKEIDLAKSEFISMASHQLRTPLTSVGLSVELLLRGIFNNLDERHQGYLKEIHSSTRRMTDLISALLNVSRIEMGTFSVKLEFLEIVGRVKRIVEELNEQFINKKISLETEYGTEECDVNFDPNIFRIVFENIVTNAIRYTPAGGKITIAVEKKEGRTIISVKDTGLGIPAEDQEKIFEKSYRSEGAKQISSDGTGLGLYIARSVAKKVGADIWVESKVGEGSTFFFSIPAV